MAAQAQLLTIIGDPIHCDRRGCGEPAVVYLREDDGDGGINGIAYCESCWLSARRVYCPLTAHDTPAALAEAEQAMRKGAQ